MESSAAKSNLKEISGTGPLSRILSTVVRAVLLALVTFIVLEAALQLIFPHLPNEVIKTMPQFYDRAGFRSRTEHGAREFPAWKHVDYEVTAHFGDLFSLSCLSSQDAPPTEPYRLTYTTDSHGFRNDEPWPDAVDLVVIGDSFTAAEAIVEPFWQGISESSLVFGLPGSGTVEQQRLFEYFALPRQPETVVLAFFAGNDLADSKTYADMRARGELFGDRVQSGKVLTDYSVLLRLLMLYIHQSRKASTVEPPCLYPQIAETEPPTPVTFLAGFLPVLGMDEEILRSSEMYQLTRKSISEMATDIKARGGDFVLMYIPQKAELYWNYLSEGSKQTIITEESKDRRRTGLELIDTNITAQRILMKEMSAELEITFLDLTGPLHEAVEDGQQPYFFGDTHWNQSGHNIARIALLDFLNQPTLDK